MLTLPPRIDRIAVAVIAATVAATPSISVSQTKSKPRAFEALQLRGVTDLPVEMLIDLAQTGKPIWHVVGDRSEPLKQIIRQECGEQPPEVAVHISNQAAALNVVDGLQATFQPGDVVAVPFCLKVEQNTLVRVAPGDTPSDILKREYGVFGALTTQRFYELNSNKYPSFEAFVGNLRVDDVLTIPYAAQKRIYNPLTPSSNGVDELLASIPQRNVREQLSMSVAAVSADPDRDRFALEHVKSIEFTGTDPSIACNGAPGQVAQIVDAVFLEQRFKAEKQARDAYFTAAPASAGLLSTTVGVVDSGLGTIGDDFFNLKFFLPDIDELNGVEERDEDGNNLVDDVYGRTYSSFGKPGNHSIPFLKPFETARGAAHGTKMAALVLGGLSIATNWTGVFDTPPVQLKIVKFTDRDETVADSALLPDALNYLKAKRAPIVNLSLSAKQRIVGLRNQIRQSEEQLFVVAAGNEPSGGLDLRLVELYPAGFGGKNGEPNVIVVGAHDLSGLLAKFSHFSESAVDLFAPGCAVRTRDHLKKEVIESGTSPAAAIVSFAAALVRALGLHEAPKIKHRLLMGSDFDPELLTKAHSGGRLNVIKAISVYHDVVEFEDRLVFGSLVNPRELLNACVTPPLTNRPVHKFVLNLSAGASKELIYWVEVDDRLERSSCTQANESFNVSIEIEGAIENMPIENIREVIIGTKVKRQQKSNLRHEYE